MAAPVQPPQNYAIPAAQFGAAPNVQSSNHSAEFLLSNYRLGKTLGIGSFGKVKIAEHITTQHKVAIKILNRKKIQSMDMEEKVRREIKILRLFMHPHIIRLYEVIETPTDFYVVMEYVKGGELFDYIVEKGRLTEDDARRFFQQIISGVEYCHRNMVVHRDLKPENLLLDSRLNVKIADFGLSNVMRDGHFLKTSCGSPNYAAPEVISGKLYAGPEVDVWSCGVILYALLCGSLPFDDENIPNLFKKIKGGLYQLPTHLSPGARDLIPKMLLVDPLKRITIPEIRQHYWFTQRLPRYLAVMQADSMGSQQRVDEEVVAEVLAKVKGVTRELLIDSLQRRVQDKATVAYHLLLDNRKRFHSSGYLSAELSEAHPNQPPHTGYAAGGHTHPAHPYHTHGAQLGANAMQHHPPQQQRLVAERKWRLGAYGRGHPSQLMQVLYRALQANKVSWKKQTAYNLKCRTVVELTPARLQNTAMLEDTAPVLPSTLMRASPTSPSGVAPMSPLSADGPLSHAVGAEASETSMGLPAVDSTGEVEEVMAVEHLVKFEVQLYKVRDEEYVIDMQRLEGDHLIYLDVCGAILSSFPSQGLS